MESAAAPPEPHRLLAAIDMGTNSFKLVLVWAHPSGRFLAVDRLTSPVILGRSLSSDGSLSLSSQLRAITALRSFSRFLQSHEVYKTRLVATSAVRNAPNRTHLLSNVRSQLGFQIDVLSGEEEARLIYLGILQFLPVYNRSVLVVDIGGGSTEFVLGFKGKVIFATSLDLGHVSLTESFSKNGKIADLRCHIRTVLYQSSLVEKVKVGFGFDIAVGSSGTIRSIERAVSSSNILGGEFRREWTFGREELESLVDKLCDLELLGLEGVKKLGFSKRRGEFIVAGAILLLEIFEALGIEEMEVSGYALGEGVVAEMLASSSTGFDVNVNARWRSVVGLAVRFDGENRMKLAVQCVGIAKDIFNGIRKYGGLSDDRSKSLICLDEKDFEYLEAAILLHNIGLVVNKKGYHKCSYQIIKLIALLARFHRKKFPRCEHSSLQEFSVEMKRKFRVLCIIVRLSLNLQQLQCVTCRGLEILHTHEGFKLVLSRLKDQLLVPHGVQLTSAAVEAELRPELDHFEEVFQQKISVLIP